MKPDWTTVALGDVCQIISGATPKTKVADYWDGDVPWATPKDLSDLGGAKLIEATARCITESGLNSCATTVLPAGSVLLSSRAPIGLVAINTVPMATNQGFKSLVPSDHLNASFLYWWLRTHRRSLEARGRGATFKEISRTVTAEIELPLPPLEEQKRIAAILDKADELQAKRRAVITHLDSLTQAIFLDMFGRSCDGSRSSRRLGAVADLVTKGTTPTSVGFAFAAEGIPFVRAQDLANSTVEADAVALFIDDETDHALRRSRVLPNDVLISIAGTIGRVALVPKDAPRMNCNQAVAIVRGLAELTPLYLLTWLGTRDAQAQMRDFQVKGTISNLSLSRIKELVVPVPPIERQSDFEARVDACSRAIAGARSFARSMTELGTSLQVRAFRGEL